MKYERVVITRPGGPEVLRVVEEFLREPGPGEVRVRTLAAGVSFADIFMREGFHPESVFRRTPFTPGWDIVGRVDATGAGVTAVRSGDLVAALPIVGGYSQVVYLTEEELVPVPPGVDPGEAVSLVLNYVTAYQMLHRTARVQPGRATSCTVGSTASEGRQTRSAIAATSLAWLWAFSYNLVPGYKRVKLYSIQMLKRRHPGWFRDDLTQLLGLLSEGRIHPVVAERFPLTEARRAHELLATGSTTGKLVLTFDEAERPD